MIVDRSVFSQDMKNVKHAFYVHQNAKRVFFTYNKIKNFMTKNPLLAVLAFFTEICKSGKYEREDVVRNLYKGFTENCKLAWEKNLKMSQLAFLLQKGGFLSLFLYFL